MYDSLLLTLKYHLKCLEEYHNSPVIENNSLKNLALKIECSIHIEEGLIGLQPPLCLTL